MAAAAAAVAASITAVDAVATVDAGVAAGLAAGAEVAQLAGQFGIERVVERHGHRTIGRRGRGALATIGSVSQIRPIP